MKLFLKTCVVGIGLVLVGIAVVALLLVSQADSMVKGPLEHGLGFLVGTRVTLEAVRVLPMRGALEIRGLALFNPPPFKAEPALKAERIVVSFDPKTLFSASPVIDQVLLDGAQVEIRYELGKGTNVGALARKAGGEADDEPKNEAAAAEKTGGRAFVVKQARCEHAKVSLSTNLLPGSAGIDLAPFTLDDLGEEPISPGKIVSLFLRTFLKEALTLKGLLDPVAILLRHEIGGAAGGR